MPKETPLQRTKSAPPPPELPIYGHANPAEVTFIGRTNYVAALEEKKIVFGIKRRDRTSNVYIIGKSGVGKSKLIELMARQDIAGGHGVCIFDPTADIIESLTKFIPENRAQDTVIIDPTNLENPVRFNPFRNLNPEFRHQFTEGLLEIIELQFGPNWNPQLEHILRLACLALLDFPEANIPGLITMLTEKEYRETVIPHIKDPIVKKFWRVDFPAWKEKFDFEAVMPLANKLSQLLLNPYLRNALGNQENTIDFTRFISEKKIILVNLAKDKLGEKNSSFFGGILIIKIKEAYAILSHQKQKNDFYLYLDEFPLLVTKTFEGLLSESRKYNLSITLSDQSLNKLSSATQAVILGNVGALIIFRVTAEDATKLKPETAPVFDVKDMTNLSPQHFYIKMTIDGEVYDPFSAETLKITEPLPKSYPQS